MDEFTPTDALNLSMLIYTNFVLDNGSTDFNAVKKATPKIRELSSKLTTKRKKMGLTRECDFLADILQTLDFMEGVEINEDSIFVPHAIGCHPFALGRIYVGGHGLKDRANDFTLMIKEALEL